MAREAAHLYGRPGRDPGRGPIAAAAQRWQRAVAEQARRGGGDVLPAEQAEGLGSICWRRAVRGEEQQPGQYDDAFRRGSLPSSCSEFSLTPNLAAAATEQVVFVVELRAHGP